MVAALAQPPSSAYKAAASNSAEAGAGPQDGKTTHN
jgi:hypothetical protein